MNSMIRARDAGRVVVIDGGTAADAPYLRGFLAALGNRVEWWFDTIPVMSTMTLTESPARPAASKSEPSLSRRVSDAQRTPTQPPEAGGTRLPRLAFAGRQACVAAS